MQESHRHFCLFKCWQQMIEILFGNVLTLGGGFNLLIMAEFSKVMAYNMGEDGWEVKKKKVFSLMPEKSILPHTKQSEPPALIGKSSPVICQGLELWK